MGFFFPEPLKSMVFYCMKITYLVQVSSDMAAQIIWRSFNVRLCWKITVGTYPFFLKKWCWFGHGPCLNKLCRVGVVAVRQVYPICATFALMLSGLTFSKHALRAWHFGYLFRETRCVLFLPLSVETFFKYLTTSKTDGKIRKSISERNDYKNVRKEIIHLK